VSPALRCLLGVEPSIAAKGGSPVGKAIDFMEAHLERSLDLAMIAEAAGISPSHFARRFRATVGKAPHQYLIQIRIDRAKRLLSENDKGIAEIAPAASPAKST
jgi:AraC family transcriptional regulator